MNQAQADRMHVGKGFVAALDQSGGSTPKALAAYGIGPDRYSSDKEMFDRIHAMRKRVLESPAFRQTEILGAILFEDTMDREVAGVPTADFLWEHKKIVPFLKIDKGLEDPAEGVRLMKPIPELKNRLRDAVAHHIFGTKMRSIILKADERGISAVVAQQFAIGRQIFAEDLVPILEPEVDIHIPDKAEAEDLLKQEILRRLADLPDDVRLFLKLSLPSKPDFYRDLTADPHVVRILALSGGYTRDEADKKLAENHGVIASFSRALLADLSAKQTDAEFNAALETAVRSIYQASIT